MKIWWGDDDDGDGEGGGIPGSGPKILKTEGIYGGYGEVPGSMDDEKHLGLTKNQWLMVGAAGVALYYFKGRK